MHHVRACCFRHRSQPMIRVLPATIAVLALSAGCTPKHIPGTEIQDNSDTRGILNVMEKYRSALEAKDAAGILAIVSPAFRDDGGTPNPTDDLDFAGLQKSLPQRLSRAEDVHVDLDVRKITVEKENGL